MFTDTDANNGFLSRQFLINKCTFVCCLLQMFMIPNEFFSVWYVVVC